MPIMADWASLLPELVQGIANCVLFTTTGGVDAYMNMRAVCPSWRSAISKPSPLAAVADHRFRPRHWLMVDMDSDNHDDDARLFLHAPTGRFRHLRLPALRNHTLVGATDGLLVLHDKKTPHLTRVFNPFTGDTLNFIAPFPGHGNDNLAYTSVDGGSRSTLVLLRWGKVLSAAPTSHVFTEEDIDHAFLVSMVNFQGNLYCADIDGYVFKFVAPAELVVIAQVLPSEDIYAKEDDDTICSFLVESAGELLLVRNVDMGFKVFRVDIKHKLLEKVESLGGHHALFLGQERCVSIDVDKLPSVDGDCIYIFDFEDDLEGDCVMCVYNLRSGTVDIISGENYLDQPFSLVQVLLQYCNFSFD